MRIQISIKVSRIAKADKLRSELGGTHIHVVVSSSATGDWPSTLTTEFSLFTMMLTESLPPAQRRGPPTDAAQSGPAKYYAGRVAGSALRQPARKQSTPWPSLRSSRRKQMWSKGVRPRWQPAAPASPPKPRTTTTSFNACQTASLSPARICSAASIIRCSIHASPFRRRSSISRHSVWSTWIRNPRRPILIPRIGDVVRSTKMTRPQHRAVAAHRDHHVEITRLHAISQTFVVDRSLGSFETLVFQEINNQVRFGEGLGHLRIRDDHRTLGDENVRHIE